MEPQEKGRIVVQLYDDVPVGAARFADLAQGKQGVGFRRTKFDAINEVRCPVVDDLCAHAQCQDCAALMPCSGPCCASWHQHAADQAGGAVQDFIRDAGLRRLSFGSEQETALAGELHLGYSNSSSDSV